MLGMFFWGNAHGTQMLREVVYFFVCGLWELSNDDSSSRLRTPSVVGHFPLGKPGKTKKHLRW